MSLFLDALSCTNKASRPPVWIMRQAGRYMPSYRKLREKHSLWEMFHTPELAAQVTLLPIDLLGVDAAILFSDILVIAEMLGLTLHFPETGGPKVTPALASSQDLARLLHRPAKEALSYVSQTIALLKPSLSVPLIGFCGGPFTIASYLIEPGKALPWAESDPASFHRLLQHITDASIDYLKMQAESGVQAVQIFDSWANLLTPSQFALFSLPYLKQLVEAIRPLPTILFCRSSSLYPRELSALQPAAISFDWHQDMKTLRQQVPPSIAVQGNLAPDLLKSPLSSIRSHTTTLLHSMQGEPGFIVNLGHGVLPDTPFDHVKEFVELIRRS